MYLFSSSLAAAEPQEQRAFDARGVGG